MPNNRNELSAKPQNVYVRKYYATHKEQHKKHVANWRTEHKKQIKEYDRRYYKEYYLVHREELKEKAKTYREEHKEHIKERRKEYNKEYRGMHNKETKEWWIQHPEKTKLYNAKRRSSPKGRLSHTMGSCIYSSLQKGIKSGRHWENLVGYTINELKQFLERRFKVGMTWENYGKEWHIDHVMPISAFNYEKAEDYDFKRCWRLENLQPMWVVENMKKGNKLEQPFQPSLLL